MDARRSHRGHASVETVAVVPRADLELCPATRSRRTLDAYRLPEPQRIEREQSPAGLQPYSHPYYWAGFVLLGDPR